MSSAQIKNSFSSIGEVDASLAPASLMLKLCVSFNSLRYFIISQTHHQIVFFGDYTLHHVTNSGELVVALEKIFGKDEILKLPFAKVLMGLDEKYTLVPNEFIHLVETENKLLSKCANTTIVFDNHASVLEILNRFFQKPELLHLNSTFLHLLPEYLAGFAEKIFINVGKGYLDIIRFDNEKKLQLMNRYEYQTASDYIYFLLLCCEELKIDREATELVLLGEVDIQSKIYDICYHYFQSISFIKKPDNIYFSKLFESYPKHLHFNLYNLSV